MKWYFKCLNKYAVFSGRARRREYWNFYLFWYIFLFIIIFIEISLGIGGEERPGLLGIGYILFTFIPLISAGVRRMHDTGRSGAALLWGFIPIIGWAIQLVFLLSDSQPGENIYGPNPKADEFDYSL